MLHLSIYSNISPLYKKGTFYHKKSTFDPFKKMRGKGEGEHVAPVPPVPSTLLYDVDKLETDNSC